MAQALPRSCPRCGAPIQAHMRRCSACGLPVEAIFNRSKNIPRRPRTTTGTSESPIQQDEQQQATPFALTENDALPAWDLPTTIQPAYLDSTPRPVAQEPPQLDWNTPTHSLNQSESPWQTPATPATYPALTSGHVPQEETEQGQNKSTNLPDPSETLQQALYPNSGHVTPEPSQPGWNGPTNLPDPSETLRQAPVAPTTYPNPGHVTPEPSQPGWNSATHSLNQPETASPWSTQEPQRQQTFYTPAPQNKGKRRLIILLILFLILLVLGGGGYLAISLLNPNGTGLGRTQAQIKTTTLNTTVTYAGSTITITNVQQAQNFLDDPHSTDNGMIRVTLHSQNPTGVTINQDYTTIAQLLSKGEPALKPLYVKSKASLAAGATQTSLLDFPILNGGTLSNLTLQIGAPDEAQMQIPLNQQSSLTRYQPQTSRQSATTAYFGLNWTLTGTTTSLNIPGTQAPKDMEYLTLNLQIDSPLSQEAITGSPFDYLKVNGGGETASLVSTTLPVSFAAEANGVKGTALFLIPQKSKGCSLVLVSQDPGGSGQASIDFQI